jgi:hypothetical protein
MKPRISLITLGVADLATSIDVLPRRPRPVPPASPLPPMRASQPTAAAFRISGSDR